MVWIKCVIQDSFDSVCSLWIEEIARYTSGDVIRVLIGNKCDVVNDQRKVSTADGQVFVSMRVNILEIIH